MKNNDRLLKVLGEVRDDFIPEAECKRKKSRPPIKWAAAGAVTAAAAAGFFLLQNTGGIIDLTKEEWEDYRIYKEISFEAPSDELPKISRGNLNGNGFEVYLYHDISEYGNNNPWNENARISALPVFKNLAFSGNMQPIYFGEDEMTKMAENAAKALGLSVSETEGRYYGKNEDILYGIKAVCVGESLKVERVEISVDSDGTIKVDFNFPSFADSEEYGLVYTGGYGLDIPGEYIIEPAGRNSESGAEEAEKTVNYLTERFKNLLQFKNPASDTYKGPYNSDALVGSFSCREYGAYDKSESLAESIVNYNLSRAGFSCMEEGKLNVIYLNNHTASSEYMGDYPVISLEGAKKKLMNGEYLSVLSEDDAKGGKISEDVIAKAELVYLNYRQEYFQPFYRFLVELNQAPYGSADDESLIPYGAYYVHAVEEEYLLDKNGENVTSDGPQTLPYELSEYPFVNNAWKELRNLENSGLLREENPWNEGLKLDAMPVYRLSALSDEEMTAIANDTAKKLGISAVQYIFSDSEGQYGEKTAYRRLKAMCTGAGCVEKYGVEAVSIVVYSFGDIRIVFDGNETDDVESFWPLPEGYKLDAYDTSAEDEEKSLDYLIERFGDVLGFGAPVKNSYTVQQIDFSGEDPDSFTAPFELTETGITSQRRHEVYNGSEDVLESILNYSMDFAEFTAINNRISVISLSRKLAASEREGEYPIISVEEAREKLLAGDYQTGLSDVAAAGDGIAAENIVDVQLIYRCCDEKYLVPVYRFYAEAGMAEGSESLKKYAALYVHAVREEYLSEGGRNETENELESFRCTLSDYPFSYTLADHYGSGIRTAEDISALEDSNPWNEELNIDRLPVYEMFGLNSAQMNELLKNTAQKMGLTVRESSFVKNQSPNADKVPYMALMGFCEGEYHGVSNITIIVLGTGDIEVYFNKDGFGIDEDEFVLPDEYVPDIYAPEDSAAEAAKVKNGLQYLSEEFNDLLQLEAPVLNSYVKDRTVAYASQYDPLPSAVSRYGYRVYEDSEDIVGRILNYNLSYADISLSLNSVQGITLTDKRFASEKLGDYPIITAEEARRLLIEGKYLISFSKDYIKDGELKAEDVKKTELVYRFSESRYLMPFYRFYAEIEAVPVLNDYRGSGLKEYGEFYVPAVKSEYIAGDPYAAKREQAVIDSYYYDSVPLPDGSAVSADEASETFGDTSAPGLIFNFAFMRYGNPVFLNTLDNPEIYDFGATSFNIPDGKATDATESNCFKVKAGDVLENGLTVKSASCGVKWSGAQSVYTSRIILDGELTLDGILCRTDGIVMFFPDPSLSRAPLMSPREWSCGALPDYRTDFESGFAMVTDGGVIYPKNDFDAEEFLSGGNYVKGKLTLRNLTFLNTDWEDMARTGMSAEYFETAEFKEFEAE